MAPQLIKPILRSLRPTYDYDYVKPLERTYKSLKSAVMAAQRFANNNFEDGESPELCETEIKDAIDDDGEYGYEHDDGDDIEFTIHMSSVQ